MTKKSKDFKSSTLVQDKPLTIAEYAEAFNIHENSVRAKLKKGELELTYITKNGRKVQAVIVDSSKLTENKPKLLKVDTLKKNGSNPKESIREDKSKEIKKLKEELAEMKKVLENKNEQLNFYVELLKSKNIEIDELKSKLNSQQQTPKPPTFPSQQKEKKQGLLGWLFPQKSSND